MNNIDLFLENQSLKFEFAIRNLDLSQVFYPTPDDLERENGTLRRLLDWVQRYAKDGDRDKMEAEGYLFPPIAPDVSPVNDWYQFERWMQGRPIRQKLKEQLPPDYSPKSPDLLDDEALLAELGKLTGYLADLRISVDFQGDLPPRLVYTELLDILEEEFDTLIEGFWHLDGCTGYCPGCFQRPWCETGGRLCWSEDEEAGKMYLIDALKDYVSASPMSLSILRKFQAEEDREFEEFRRKREDRDIPLDPWPDNFGDDELPF